MAAAMTRRTVLRNAALGGVGLILLRDSRSARGFVANERVNVALVGVAGRGSWFSDTMPNISNVVAMCDVNERKAAPYFKAIPEAKKYSDFRKMLEEMDKQIDAVVVATPDNTHAVISAMAIRMGKGVYYEKPLAEFVLLGNVATLVGKPIEYDPIATKIVNSPEANAALKREYREGWAL